MTWGWNIYLRSRTDQTAFKRVGKIVHYKRKPIYHFWTEPGNMRITQEAYGVREAVLAHCLDHGVEWHYQYDKHRSLTYAIDYIGIMTYGIRGVEDQYGKTINVPIERMRAIKGKLTVPFLPDEQCKYVDPDHERDFPVLDPRVPSGGKPVVANTTQSLQMGLWEGAADER